MLLAPTPVWAENYPINFGNGAIDLGGEPTQSEIPEIPIEEVPGSDAYFVLNSSAFQVSTGNLSAQDTNNSVANLGYVVSSTPPALGGILIQDQEGKTLYDSKDNTDRFKVSGADGIFSYKLMTSLSTVGNSWDFKLNRELTHIQLTQQQGLGVKVFGGSANVNSSELADLDVAIGGTGNVHFAFTDQQAVGGDVEMGYLYLTTDSAILADNVEGEDASTYTGKTYVGNVDGSGKDITVVFGKNNAFGQTSNLEVHSDSSVWFADKDQNQGHTQTVGGLTGSGQLNLGSAAKLTLDQNSTQNGYADIDTHTVRIANSFTGSGNAVFNVDLSDLKTGQEDPVYEVFFTDKPVDNEFTGLITLTGAALTAHNDTYSQTIGKDTYENLNSILLGATLQVKEGGLLKVDTTGEVKNLIFDQGSRIEFSGLGNNAKNGALSVNGDLTLNSDTEISIKDFDYDFVEEAEGTTLIAADEGLTNHLIEIERVLNDNNHKFTLDQDTLNQAEKSEIKQGNTTVAYGTWAFDSDLRFNEAEKTFDLVYSLTDVAIVDGQTLRLDGEKGATTTQDFTALITDHEDGAGNLLLAAGEGASDNGTIIEIGNTETEERNSYSGTTTVAEGTTAVLVEDSAFGDTSKLTALGDVILNKNVEQTVHAIDGSGNGTITLNQGAVLTVDATESQTINNLFSGTGSLVVDLGSSNNSLIFGNTRDDSFTGQLTLTNGLFSLDQTGNATLASNAGITLGAGSVFDFGSQQSTIKDLTVNADSSIKSSALEIGSQEVPHRISGTLTLNGDVTLTLEDISVATDLALINYDQGLVGQDFITAGSLAGKGSFTLAGSGEFSNLSRVTLDYQQTQNGEVSTVAETVWSIAKGLKEGETAFQAEAQLKEIHLIDDLLITGTGTDNTLTALLTDSDQNGSHSITFSNGTFTVANEGNNYSGQTSVNNGANVTLATSNAFGQTSTLKVDGTVVLDKQVQQAIGGLSGSGTITLNDGSVLSLSQNQDLTVSNLLKGNGTFDVTLGGVGNKLLFSNENATAFGGTIRLTSGSVTLESNNVTQEVLQSSALVLNNAGLLNVNGSNGSRALGSLTLNEGSSLVFSSIEMGSDAAETAQLSVTGDVTATGSSTITLGGVNLSGTLNILTADDLNGGLKQALVTAGGALSGENYLKLVTDDIPTSQICNTLEGETVAYGVWIGAGTGGSAFDVDGKTLYATLRLDEIQLAAADGTGLLLALDDTTSNRELSAKLTNYENVAGDITYSGAGTVTVTNTGNDYTGRTYVKEGATVVLGGDNVLGQTALLQVTGEGSLVNLNGHQSIGQLDLGVANALTGKGSLTLVGNGKQSEIVGANTGLEADIVLSNDHTLIANDAASVGSKGLLTLNEGTQFTLSGATTGTLSKQLKGAGSVNIVNSTIALGANNSSFTGAWALSTQNAGSTNVSVEGTSSDIDNALGSSATVQLGEGAQLSLSLDSTETTLSIDEILEGSGLLAVSGANTQSFGFESAWQTPANFAGTLSLTGIGMTVGGQSGSLGANNAANLVNADLKLNNGSILTVVGGVVDTFGTVTANAGGFNLGVMGFSTPNADEPEGTVQLNIDQLIVSGGANTTIGVALPDTNRGDIAGSVDQGSLLGNGQTPFQTLIATGSAISENTLSQLKLAEKGGVNQVSQGIFNADNEVAKGYYDFALGLSGDKTDVGILYKLTQVDILNNQTLTLSEKGTLTATLTSSGIGNLSIAEGGAVTLTAENTFTGKTTIDSGASLTANKGSLGNTQLLNVKGSFVNAGANTVDQLEATGDLTLNAALNLDHADEQTESAISAALHGKGDLSVNQGVLSIDENEKTNENEETKFAGNILLGVNGGTNAQLNLAGASGLGSGSVTFNTTGSVFSLTDSESVLFSNALKGQGVIKVNLGAADHTFAFGSTQDALVEGTLLSLTNAVFDLTADAENYNDEVAQKLIVELNAGSTLSNSGVADKTLAGLTLDGGNVDLGGLNVDVGQINLSGGALTINSETTIALDSTAQTTESGNRELTATGESLLTGSSGSGGLFDLNIFEGVGKLIGALGDTNSEGDQQVTQLTTGEDFGQTIESLYQDADGGGTIATNEHVANMTRADGKFYYDDEGDSVYLQYTFKEIELLWTQENQGLTVNNTSSDGSHLSATLTGVGNILLGGPITVSGQDNDYTGRTYILDDANITLATNNALGRTSMLEVGEGASVTLNDNLMQTVGGLAGSGALALGSGSAFTIDNSWGAQSQIAIGNTIQGTTGATGVNFTINGAYGDNDANKADLIFTKQSNLNGISLTLSNINFAINGEADLNYLTTSSADDLVIGSGATTTIAALESGSYEFNELSFAGNGGLNVTGVTLSSEGTDAVIHTDVLDLNDKGTLSVSANIADGFDILVNDSDTYTSTLIAYDQLSGNRDNLQTSPNLGESAINQDNKVVAYVGWTGDILWNPEEGTGSRTVGMSYSVANVQLAADDDEGLVLSTENTGDEEESTLTALVTDYEEDGMVVHGDITFDGGNITIGGQAPNTYHGNTYVNKGTVTLAKNAGFGETALLQIADGAKVELGSYDQTVGSLVAVGTDALSGTGALTLGTTGSQTSKIEGTNQFAGTVVLNTGHVLTLNDGAGLGSVATLKFSDATGKLVLSGAREDAFETNLSGAGTVTLSGSTDITLAGSNSAFTGTWILDESTAKVNGTTSLTVNQILGTNATITLTGAEDALSLSQAGIDQWAIDDAFTGQGQLTLTGYAGQSFGFSREWTGTGAFEGTLSVNNLTMTVGGSAGTEGIYNAANLASANFNLNNGSTLIVATQDTVVDTFNTLTVDGGTIQFNGKFGLEASPTQLGQLQVGALNGSGNISLELPESNDSVAQTIAQNDLLSIDGKSLFQALITANEGQEVSVDGWTLNGNAVTTLSGLRQDVMNGNELVAQALYDYGLKAQQNALGIGYELTTIDIQSGKTLTLTEQGELSAVVTDANGQGSLLITDDGNVTLSGENDYSGTTKVDGANAALTANAGGLGNTSGLTLTDGATFTNAGANTANVLSSTNSTINLNNTLELSGSSQITGGTVNGTGSLNVLGSLQVSGVVAGNYSGTIELGTDQQAGNLTLKDGAVGLGKGAVDLATSQSQVTVIGNDNLTLTNTYVGNGSIKVDLDLTDHVFAFNSSQATEGDCLFTGSLALTDSTYHLYEDGGKLSGATLETQDGSHIIVNTTDNIGDRTVGGLTLAGGTLDFGTLLGETNVGQIKVGDKGFSNTALTTINVALGTLTDNVGSGVFGSDAGVSVSLIEGFDASSQTTLNNLKLNDGSGALSQVIAQDDRGDVAVFGYTGGKLVGTGTGIEAQWKLSTITLTNTENKGFVINATGQTNNAGEVTAQITGSGNLEIAGGTVTLINNTHDTQNDYKGQTLISGNSTLILGSNEALGDTKDLLIKEGTTDFGSTTQTIGAMHVDKDGHFTMSGSGSLTLGAGGSVIESANTGAVSGSITLANNGTTLELQNADAIGDLTLTADANTSVTLNFGEESAFGVLDNRLTGAGTYYVGDDIEGKEDAAYVQLTNTGNSFSQIVVNKLGHLFVEDMDAEKTALNNANLTVAAGGEATLNGGAAWTLTNTLNVKEGGALAISAGGAENVFNFKGTNQSVSGTLLLTDALLTLGGQAGSYGAANAGVLAKATLNAGEGSAVHIATGDSAQNLVALTLNGGDLYFDGTLGVNVPTRTLGQLSVDSLSLVGGTLHATASTSQGSGGNITNDTVISAQANNLFQNLISITGSDGVTEEDLSEIKLNVTAQNGDKVSGVSSDIVQGNETVATGTYGYELALEDSDGKSLGVSYTLREIYLLKTLSIVENGNMTARLTGAGNLVVDQESALTLTARKSDDSTDWNDFTGATTVEGSLTAGAMTLGSDDKHTSLLSVAAGGSFTNAGANVIGNLSLQSQGSVVLEEGTTLTVKGSTTDNSIDGTLRESGDLILESGNTIVSSGQSDYNGDITLGSDEAASLVLNGHTSLGSGTITFKDSDSELSITGLTTSGSLTNLLAGAGKITVTGKGNGNDAAFTFNASQTADGLSGSSVSLSGVNYDFTRAGSDVLGQATLSLTSGTLTVNAGQSSSDRRVAGLTLSNATVDFGTMGPDAGGVIDLQGNVLDATGTTVTFDTNLAAVTGDNGAAAMVNADAVTLVTNVQGDRTSGLTVSVGEGDTVNQYAQAIYQGSSSDPVAYIRGSVDSEVEAKLQEGGSLYDFVASLTNQTLEIVSTYAVSTSGDIALAITDLFNEETQTGAKGNLTISGSDTEVTLSHDGNTYHGVTSVEFGATLKLAKDNVLGKTSELSIAAGSTVDFGSSSQTVGALNSEGQMISGETGTLTVTNGGTVSGANSAFHLKVELDGSTDLTLKDADALGDGSVTISQADADLVLSGITGTDGAAAEYDNAVSGLGGIKLSDNANVALTGRNTFSGDLIVGKGSTVSALGDVFLHLGEGKLALSGNADFTLTDTTATGVWTWDKTVTESGVLALNRDQSVQSTELVFTDDSIHDFSGTISLKNWDITLDADGTGNTYTALKGSGANLTIGQGADATINGVVNLAGKTVAVDASGSLTFTGVAAPGSDNTELSKLTAGVLDLNDGFIINLDVDENQTVNAGALLTQDDAEGTTITVATATDHIEATVEDGVLTGGDVTVNGSAVAEDDTIRFNIAQTSTDLSKDGIVAEGIYGVSVTTDDKNLNVSYALEGVSINADKTLVFAGQDSDADNSANIFNGYIIGEGNLEISSNVVTLAGQNSFTGSTAVLGGAILYAKEGALGNADNSTLNLAIQNSGKVYIDGDNVVRGIDNHGLLVVGSWNTHEPTPDITLTLQSDESAGSVIDGSLEGTGTLRVVGNGSVDNVNPPDLKIVGSQSDFYGRLELDDGAWVELEANSNLIFGNISQYATNEISLSKNSLLTINSLLEDNANFAAVFVNGDSEDGTGESRGGRIDVTLGDADSQFKFASGQASAGFNGVFALNQGKLDLGDLYWEANVTGNALEEATLVLGSMGSAQLGLNGEASTTDSFLGGLEFNGGKLAIGSLSYDAESGSSGAGVHSMHVNLGGDGLLGLTTITGEGKSTITIEQNEVNTISADGSELLAAADGAYITLIHNIGGLVVDGTKVENIGDYLGELSNDLLMLDNQTQAKQVLAQRIDGFDDPQKVAEVVRTFDQGLTLGKSTISGEDGKYALTVGYTVNQIGLLFETGSVSGLDDTSVWQGLNIVTSSDVERNNYQANIVDGSAQQGNIVFRGNGQNTLTLSGDNTYHGKTWVTDNAQVVFGAEHAFGSTQALRIDENSSVNFGRYSQTIGSIWALGSNALVADSGSVLTINGGLISGANTGLAARINITGELTIKDAASLGSGLVTLGNTGSHLKVNGVDGTLTNAFAGISGANISLDGNSSATFNSGAIDDYEGGLNVAEGSSLALTLKAENTDSDIAFGNRLDVGGSLSVSTTHDGAFHFANAGSSITGGLEVHNAHFDLSDENNLNVLQGVDLTVGNSGVVNVSTSVGTDHLTGLTLNDGSTLVFENGATPGTAGGDELAHIDLDEGSLNANGHVKVAVNVDKVNADWVQTAGNTTNLPLTAQDVLSASDEGQILANLVSAGRVNEKDVSFDVEVNVADNGSYADEQLTVDIFNNTSDQKTVAQGIYDYKITLDGDGLNLAYGLSEVKLIDELVLNGYADKVSDDVLSITVSGNGDLRIGSGAITLTGENSYEGVTTVAAGATLTTGQSGSALGQTSLLDLEGASSQAYIKGNETVRGLNVASGAQLALENTAELTIDNSDTGTQSVINGTLTGSEGTTLIVAGGGYSSKPDLIVNTANKDFLGDTSLEKAHVLLTNLDGLGTIRDDEVNIISLDNSSVLEISSAEANDSLSAEGEQHDLHRLTNLIKGDGTVLVSLADSEDYFDFAEAQYDYVDAENQNFKGTFELQSGIFKFNEDNADVLNSVAVVLDGDATFDLSVSGNTKDRTMKALTLSGGTLKFGSLAMDSENAEANGSHVNLNDGNLVLDDSQRKVEIAFEANATNTISSDGSEIVSAAGVAGSKVVLIHDIGHLYLVDNGIQTELLTSDENQEVLNDYLEHALADESSEQLIQQSIGTKANGEQDLQSVAQVNREFGSFGYADLASVGLDNALYVNYKIDSIDLLYSGSSDSVYGEDGSWKGLTVSSSGTYNELTAKLTGNGNLVITKGDKDPLKIGYSEGNEYSGRTWVTNGASVEFVADQAFGNTSQLRIDDGATVNLVGFDQTVGSLLAYGDNALQGTADSVITVTGSSTISGTNDEFKGAFVFDSSDKMTGTVTDVNGLGASSVSIGENYTLVIADTTFEEGAETIAIDNTIKDVNGKGGVLQIGQTGLQGQLPIELVGNNSGFSGDITVSDNWSLVANVTDNGSIADRLGTGNLAINQYGEAQINFTDDVSWNHSVTGSGNLVLSTQSGNKVGIDSGLEDTFTGTLTVGGGTFDLAQNADKLGAGQLAAEGEEAQIVVSSDQTVSFDKNLTVSDGASLVFGDTVNLSEEPQPELNVGGTLTLNGAQVEVTIDGELDVGNAPSEALDMSALTMADEADLSYVIAQAGLIDLTNSDLLLNGKTEYNPMSVAITNGTHTIAQGKYDFDLGVSTDRTELGLSYHLKEVAINDGETLALAGAIQGETAAVDWANASEFSAAITGDGGIGLVEGNLTLSGSGNSYTGDTVIGGADGSAVLTVESSLGNTSHVVVNQTGKLVNVSDETQAGYLTVAGGEVELQSGSALTILGQKDSVVDGTLTGSGALTLQAGDFEVVSDGDYRYSGKVTVGDGASFTLSTRSAQTVSVTNSFAANEGSAGTVAFNGSGSTYQLLGSAVELTGGTFLLGDNVTVEADNINAIGGAGSELLITTADDTQATFAFDYDESKSDKFLKVTQQMTEGITFAKSGTGVVHLSDKSLGAGAVDVSEGGLIFGEIGSKTQYATNLAVEEDAWAAGFGGVATLSVDSDGAFYVGGRSGYNSLTEAADNDGSKTVTFTVGSEGHTGTALTNSGTIYVGNKTDVGQAPSDADLIGNELVINGDYVTSTDGHGGILDMNAIIAGNDGSKADHVTITGGIIGQGYIDVNYDATASTGGKLDYLGLVSVGEGEDPDNLSLKLKDSIKINDLYYALMYSTEQNEYYLMSSVTDPGDDPWKTEEVENVQGASRSALAFVQSQTFDLSLHDHVGETLYVDPITGEERSTSFWMIQRGDWTKFSNASGQIDSDGHVYTTHLGGDVITHRTDNATYRVGIVGSFADGKFDMKSNVNGKSAEGQFRGYSAGLYMTAQSDAESGPYAGLQVRWNRFSNEIGADDYHVDGLSVTAEAGVDMLLSKGTTETGRSVEWRVEPHVRAHWTDFGNPDTWTSEAGETVSSSFDNGMLFRVGARTKVASMKGAGPAVQAYAEANWVYNYGDYKTTVSTKYGDVKSTQSPTNFGELRLGFETQFTPNVNVWFEGHHHTGSNDYKSSGAMVGFKYQW